jgi:hypothetical protein
MHMYVCMNVCTHVCMYVRTNVRMNVCIPQWPFTVPKAKWQGEGPPGLAQLALLPCGISNLKHSPRNGYNGKNERDPRACGGNIQTNQRPGRAPPLHSLSQLLPSYRSQHTGNSRSCARDLSDCSVLNTGWVCLQILILNQVGNRKIILPQPRSGWQASQNAGGSYKLVFNS